MGDYFLRSRVAKTSRSSSTSTSTRPAEQEPPPSLPDDLLIEILKRLPLKSLVRFTCICKSWFFLITSPSFISTVANFNYSNSNRIEKSLLFRESINIHLVSYRTNYPVYDCVNLVKQTEFKCPVGRKHFVVSSADGLVCLFDFYSKDPIATPLILWNPSIKRADRVAAPPGCSSALEFTPGGFPKLIFGFGFDLVSGDYKAVRVTYFKRGQGRLNGTSFHTYVYCVGAGVWMDLGLGGVLHNVITIRWRGVCLNGVIHWVCNVIVNGGIRKLILTLKLENAEFGEIQLPKELVDVLNLRVVMVPRANKKVLGVVHILENELSLWVMEEYAVKQSWVKLLRVTFGSIIMNDMNVLVLSDHVVLVKNMFDSWVYYDHGKERMHSVKTIQNGHDFVDTYLESLILVGHKTKILKQAKQQKPKP